MYPFLFSVFFFVCDTLDDTWEGVPQYARARNLDRRKSRFPPRVTWNAVPVLLNTVLRRPSRRVRAWWTTYERQIISKTSHGRFSCVRNVTMDYAGTHVTCAGRTNIHNVVFLVHRRRCRSSGTNVCNVCLGRGQRISSLSRLQLNRGRFAVFKQNYTLYYILW